MTAAEHVDAVVIGSGFGGSVLAYRLQEAGLHVCLLERGKAYPPGSFPRSPHTLLTNVWAPDDGTYGLYDYWSFRTFDALVASGLGGGSLIYANVLLRKDERWFVQEDPGKGGMNIGRSRARNSTRTTTRSSRCSGRNTTLCICALSRHPQDEGVLGGGPARGTAAVPAPSRHHLCQRW